MISTSDVGNTTPTDYVINDTSGSINPFIITKTDCYDYEKREYINEEREWIKEWWFNPIKIQLPKKQIYKKINIIIRNALPYKIRPPFNAL